MKDFFKPDLPEETIYHVGVSGGKDSTAVLLWMVHESGIPHYKINATFADTGNEHPHTLEQVALLSETVFPITKLHPLRGFYELVRHKGLFPSNARRYCTNELKVIPATQHITGLQAAAKVVVAVSGVRAAESDKRKNLEEWDYSQALLALQWRPLIRWTLQDVLGIHRKYGVRLNPLYGLGASRVGCFPCIYSAKKEIRLAAEIAPERIDVIKSLEESLPSVATFFNYDKVPLRFRSRRYVKKDGTPIQLATISDVVRWSKTGRGAKGSYLDDKPEPITCVSGFCE